VSLPDQSDFDATLVAIIDALEAITGFTRGPQLIDAQTNPTPALANKFSLHVASSKNLNLYRGTSPVAVEHQLLIGMCFQVQMSDQYASLQESLALDQKLMSAPGINTMYGPVRWEWVGCKRTLTPTREFLITVAEFTLRHDTARGT